MSTGVVLYIHGQGGSADEAAHYRPLFPECEVIGLDYTAQTPWEAAGEFPGRFDALCGGRPVILIANSIGAFFAMSALSDKAVTRAYFISPVVDMERLITDMMSWGGITDDELHEKKIIETPLGEPLSWEYLTFVREHPLDFRGDIRILYGGRDEMIARDSVERFAREHGASLTVMEESVHWFHTYEQLDFLDKWVRENV